MTPADAAANRLPSYATLPRVTPTRVGVRTTGPGRASVRHDVPGGRREHSGDL